MTLCRNNSRWTPKRPLLRVGRAEVGVDGRRLKRRGSKALKRINPLARPPPAPCRRSERRRDAEMRARQEDRRRRGRDVEQQVVERRVVGDAVTATDRRLVLAEERPEQSLLESAASRQSRGAAPSCCCLSGCAARPAPRSARSAARRPAQECSRARGDVVEQIDRLPGVLVPHAEVERQVGADAPVVLEEVELVELIVSSRSPGRARPVASPGVLAANCWLLAKAKAPLTFGRKGALFRSFRISIPKLHLVRRERQAGRVGELKCFDRAALRQVGRRADARAASRRCRP